jgi:hypothetical protein
MFRRHLTRHPALQTTPAQKEAKIGEILNENESQERLSEKLDPGQEKIDRQISAPTR